MRNIFVLCLFVILWGCGKSLSDNGGSASETIAVVIGDSYISGTNGFVESESPLRATLYPCDYLPSELGIVNISGAETITITDTAFVSTGIDIGWYNLLLELPDSGISAFVDSLYIGNSIAETLMVSLSEPVDIWITIDKKSDFFLATVAVGSPFYSDAIGENRFYFPNLPKGKYTFASVESFPLDNGPDELTLYPLVESAGSVVTIDETVDTLIMQPKLRR